MTFDGTRICGVADHLGGIQCQWPFRDLFVHATGSVNGIALTDAAEVAIKGWNDICGIRLQMTSDFDKSHIHIVQARIDGPGNILADCEMPCFGGGGWRRLRCRVDNSENFVLCTGGPPAGKIDVGRTLMHEIGHGAIGVGHIEIGNLMAAMYSDKIWLPKDGDRIQALARYPVLVPKPQPKPTGDPSMGGILKDLIPCAIKYGGDLISELTPEERRALIRTAVNFWRGLSSEQKAELQAATESLRN